VRELRGGRSMKAGTEARAVDGHHGHGHHHHTHVGTLSERTDVLLTARDVHFARSGRIILEGIDLDLAPGEIVTLIGPNGAGKTTLVRILLGLERPDRGTITRRPDLSVGYAPQRFDRDPAIPMTVARFLALGSRHTPTEAEAALHEVGAVRVIGQQLSQLSGGELQRVVLARALLRRPDLLVLDEPVRGVDYSGEAELYDLIGRIRDARSVGILLVSHDLHVVMAQSDRVICINRHICCSGMPEAVAQHPEYVRLFGAEAARSFALYQHQHDHSHDLTGAALPAQEDDGSR
jgi:zinc transport system ATP-binding protein